MPTNLKPYLISALIKALAGSLIFLVIYLFANKQIIKLFAEDFSFDMLNKIVLEDDSVKHHAPSVMVFGIDDFYLKNRGLVDENNISNYGYLFPRDKIADFVSKIDSYTHQIPKAKQPQALCGL